MDNIIFAHPERLWLLLILIPITVWYIMRKKNSQATLQISSIKNLKNKKLSFKKYFRHSLFVLRVLAISGLILILARPQQIGTQTNSTSEGIDIVIALDISSSMEESDLKPTRLEASKNIAMQFINGRKFDRIGLVLFSKEAFTQCPLTTDYPALINLFKDIKTGMIEDGTAIGNGILNSVNRLKNSDAKSKVVILLTDGVSNQGDADPITAAEIATKDNIRIYTVGVGKTVFGTQYQQMGVKIDEKTLTEIAKTTNGKYFRATNNKKLKEIYKEIDKLEKSKIKTFLHKSKTEKYLIIAIISALLILLEIILRHTIFGNIP